MTAAARPTGGINYERLYDYRFRDVDQARRQAVWNEIARYLYERLGEPGSVLDPAAGRGEFITAVPADDRWGVDLFRQGDLESAGVKMVIGDIMDVELPREHFDGVFLSNFLEHLPHQDAVGAVLAKLRDAMQPGGRIAIMGPNFRYCAKNYFDCADHTVVLSHIGIEEHVYAAGFEVESVAPRFLPFSFRGVLPPSPALTRTYLRTPAMWRLLGKQFLVIGRKPSALGAPSDDR
jgi:SAM-dependent methyltransferase